MILRTRHIRRSDRSALALLLLVMAGCDAAEITEPAEPLLRTLASTYELRSDGQGNVSVEIPYEFTNTTGDSAYLPNCRGYVAPDLDKEVDGEWVHGWRVLELGCLNAPVVIEPGASYSDTLVVVHGPSWQPGFVSSDFGGMYRLNWGRARFHYDPDDPDGAEELPVSMRVSNPFTLVAP